MCYNTKEILWRAIVVRPKGTKEMNKRKRFIIFLFTAVFTLAVVSSFFFSGYEAGHDCVGGYCTVCAVLDACRDFLGKTGEDAKAAFNALFTVFAVVFSVFVYVSGAVKKSPVDLKVRLIN